MKVLGWAKQLLLAVCTYLYLVPVAIDLFKSFGPTTKRSYVSIWSKYEGFSICGWIQGICTFALENLF